VNGKHIELKVKRRRRKEEEEKIVFQKSSYKPFFLQPVWKCIIKFLFILHPYSPSSEVSFSSVSSI
jgi:hypothetical protein